MLKTQYFLWWAKLETVNGRYKQEELLLKIIKNLTIFKDNYKTWWCKEEQATVTCLRRCISTCRIRVHVRPGLTGVGGSSSVSSSSVDTTSSHHEVVWLQTTSWCRRRRCANIRWRQVHAAELEEKVAVASAPLFLMRMTNLLSQRHAQFTDVQAHVTDEQRWKCMMPLVDFFVLFESCETDRWARTAGMHRRGRREVAPLGRPHRHPKNKLFILIDSR